MSRPENTLNHLVAHPLGGGGRLFLQQMFPVSLVADYMGGSSNAALNVGLRSRPTNDLFCFFTLFVSGFDLISLLRSPPPTAIIFLSE